MGGPYSLVRAQRNTRKRWKRRNTAIEARTPIVVSTGPYGAPGSGTGVFDAPLDFVSDYLSAFRQKQTLIVVLLSLGIVAGVVVALFQTPYYRVHASVELDGVNDQYLNSRDVSPDASSSLSDGYMETQARLLGSESVVRRALQKLPARPPVKDETPSSFSLSSLLQKTGLKQFTPVGTNDSGAAAATLRNLTVRALTLTRVIEVTYDDPDPIYASSFTNTLLSEYVAANVERRWEATQDTERWLSDYVAHLKEHLESSSQLLESYATDSGLLGTKENDTPAEAKLRDLQSELSKVHVDRVSKQAIYETVANAPQDGLSPNINPSPLREYQAKLSDLRSERAQLVATLTPEHFRVQRLDSQIREMDELVKKEWEKTLMLIKADYQSALRREKLLTDSVQAQTSVVAQQAGKRVHYDMLRNDLDTNQQVYSSMLQKAKESAVLGATKPTNIHIIDPARPPALPFKPNLSIYGSVGGLSGLFLGLVWAAYSFRQEKGVIVPGMLSAVSQVRELGVIPSSRNSHYAIEYSSAPGLKKLESADLFMFSESFNATVASILNAECNGTQARLITITSALAGEGKTTVVTNLGRALANINRRVVLVDGDLRSPKLSASFDIDNTWGLNDILQSNDPIDSMPFEAMARRTDLHGLYILPSGPAARSVAGLLHSPRLGLLLAALKRHADIVLIDSPPMLVVSDARILGLSSDAVVFVIRAHKTNRDAFQTVARQLIDDGTHLLGTILNDWDPRQPRWTRAHSSYVYPYPE